MKKKNNDEIAIKALKKANREIELERNGGRWVAVNRPHKNHKKYDRKRDKKINFDLPLYFFFNYTTIFLFYFLMFSIYLV
jgi:hypothetical protein